MSTIIHEGDVGTEIKLTIQDSDGTAIDVSSATTTKKIYLQKPDGTKVVKDATFDDDGTDGIIKYTTVANDIDQPGDWQVQGYVEGTGGKYYTSIEKFEVKATLYTT
jgi:hypothetical protein